MVTHLYESFGIAELQVTPDGGILITVVETDDMGDPTGDKHLFPMQNESAQALHKQLGEKLGQKIDTANLQQMREEAARHDGVPKKRG